MTTSILDDLFKWRGKLEIKDNKGEVVLVNDKPLIIYQRVVGDADLIRARKQALKASGGLRRDLRDKTSDSYIAMIPDYEALDDETLGSMILLSEALDIRTKATAIAEKPKEPREPDSDATLEQQEEYETAVESHTRAIEEAIQEKSKELADKRIEELKGIPREKLVKIFMSTVVDSLCRSEMLRVFNSWCAYLGTYKSRRMKARAFSSYAAFDNASPELKSQILDSYIGLEFGGEDLKN
jgi:hypothetical protein